MTRLVFSRQYHSCQTPNSSQNKSWGQCVLQQQQEAEMFECEWRVRRRRLDKRLYAFSLALNTWTQKLWRNFLYREMFKRRDVLAKLSTLWIYHKISNTLAKSHYPLTGLFNSSAQIWDDPSFQEPPKEMNTQLNVWETPEVEWVINCVLLWRSSHVELSLSSHWETSHYSAALSSLWTGYRVICSLLINCPQSLTRSLSPHSDFTQRGRETVVDVGNIISGWVCFNPNPVS